MNVRDTVQELTEVGLEIRRKLESTIHKEDQEKLALAHIKNYSKKGSRVADFQAGKCRLLLTTAVAFTKLLKNSSKVSFIKKHSFLLNMPGLEWINVAKELSVYRHLSGKIIILDFFTYCCINCMHILPDLKALEHQFSVTDGLVVIGVHSAKFSNERDSGKLFSAVQRYNINHPVVNDPSLSTWKALGVTCWPTLVMIGPTGELLAVLVGEGHRNELTLLVDVALRHFESLNKISHVDIPLQLARRILPASEGRSLLFPSKLEVFRREQGEALIIADTGNNRILIADANGNVERIVGGPNPGFKDGDFDVARFNAPQGVCILGDSVYVADCENHSVRKVDLSRKIVTTVAGTGIQGHDYVGGKSGKDQVLSSPWDVAIYQHVYGKHTVPVLLIAVAGTHQIWALFLEDTSWWKCREYKAGVCIAIVGSGREENRNNSYPHAAGLAQPSGLVVLQDKRMALFADSESSAVRSIDLQNGRVSAVCGGNQNPADLHDYGDRDGVRYAAKLQHPLGVAWHPKDNIAYVADTYNHKVKRIDVISGDCNTVYGGGVPDESFSFDEPSGIAVSSVTDLLYVADTNNHAVKIIDTRDKSITTLPIKLPSTDGDGMDKGGYFFDTTVSEKGGEVNVTFSIAFRKPELKINLDAPQKWSIDPSNDQTGWTVAATRGDLSNPVRINIPKGNRLHEVPLTLNFVACTASECLPKKLYVVYRIIQKANAPTVVTEQRKLVVEQ